MLTTVLALVGVILFAAAVITIWAFGVWDFVAGRAARQRQATEMLMRGPAAWGLPTNRNTTDRNTTDRTTAEKDTGKGQDASAA